MRRPCPPFPSQFSSACPPPHSPTGKFIDLRQFVVCQPTCCPFGETATNKHTIRLHFEAKSSHDAVQGETGRV